MRAVWRGLVLVVVFAGFIAGGLMGIFAVAGLTAFLWGPAILEGALGGPPDRSHPAFWFFLALMGPAMVVGFVGTFFCWVVPLCYLSGVRLGGEGREEVLIRYASWLRAISRPTGPERAAFRPPRPPSLPWDRKVVLLACVRVGAFLSALVGVWFVIVLVEQAAPSFGRLRVGEKTEVAPGRYSITATSDPNKNGGTLTYIKNYPKWFYDKAEVGDWIVASFGHCRLVRDGRLMAIHFPWGIFPTVFIPLAWCLPLMLWLPRPRVLHGWLCISMAAMLEISVVVAYIWARYFV